MGECICQPRQAVQSSHEEGGCGVDEVSCWGALAALETGQVCLHIELPHISQGRVPSALDNHPKS